MIAIGPNNSSHSRPFCDGHSKQSQLLKSVLLGSSQHHGELSLEPYQLLNDQIHVGNVENRGNVGKYCDQDGQLSHAVQRSHLGDGYL